MAEEVAIGREYLQVSEEHIHKVAEKIKIFTKTVPLQLPLFMQPALKREHLCPQSLP